MPASSSAIRPRTPRSWRCARPPQVLGDGWRLEGATLAVTVEPCTMCAGALVMARVARLVFGAWEPKTGAVGSLWDVVRDRRLTHRPEVRGGVLAASARGRWRSSSRGSDEADDARQERLGTVARWSAATLIGHLIGRSRRD